MLPMGLSIWHLMIILIWFVPAFPAARILKRVGFNPWWAILYPFLGFLVIWVLAYSRWPKDTPPGIVSSPNA
jgi:hypothetical protein